MRISVPWNKLTLAFIVLTTGDDLRSRGGIKESLVGQKCNCCVCKDVCLSQAEKRMDMCLRGYLLCSVCARLCTMLKKNKSKCPQRPIFQNGETQSPDTNKEGTVYWGAEVKANNEWRRFLYDFPLFFILQSSILLKANNDYAVLCHFTAFVHVSYCTPSAYVTRTCTHTYTRVLLVSPRTNQNTRWIEHFAVAHIFSVGRGAKRNTRMDTVSRGHSANTHSYISHNSFTIFMRTSAFLKYIYFLVLLCLYTKHSHKIWFSCVT